MGIGACANATARARLNAARATAVVARRDIARDSSEAREIEENEHASEGCFVLWVDVGEKMREMVD